MKILISPDKFKGTLSAQGVADALKRGILKSNPKFEIDTQPMADGGDGSIELLKDMWGLNEIQVEVHDPIFRKIISNYLSNGIEAFVELPLASGYALLKPEEKNPLKTTTIGTGELILDAFQKGHQKINLFIGGSSTNDAAIGIAKALGYSFFDKHGKELLPIGENLIRVDSIKKSDLVDKIKSIELRVVCDVNNPFYGEKGAAKVYSRQKGADDESIEFLDKGLRNIDYVFQKEGFGTVQNFAGAGAAGGVGGGMKAMFGIELTSGIDLFVNLFKLEKRIKNADFVISGEGQIDSQSLDGKVIGGIVKICSTYQKPLLLVCGRNGLDNLSAFLNKADKIEIHSTSGIAPSIEESMKNPAKYLEKIGSQLDFSLLS